jgi:hypothetical protein
MSRILKLLPGALLVLLLSWLALRSQAPKQPLNPDSRSRDYDNDGQPPPGPRDGPVDSPGGGRREKASVGSENRGETKL